MPGPKLVSAARILVYINNKLYGRCVSFSWSSNTPRKKIHTIDIPHPVELAATTAEITWNMGIVRVIGDGGAQGTGLITTLPLLSWEKYFSVVLIERGSGLPIFRSDYNNVDAESWSIVAKDLVRGQISASGITWTNEAA